MENVCSAQDGAVYYVHVEYCNKSAILSTACSLDPSMRFAHEICPTSPHFSCRFFIPCISFKFTLKYLWTSLCVKYVDLSLTAWLNLAWLG